MSASSIKSPRSPLPVILGIQNNNSGQKLSSARGGGFGQSDTDHLLYILDTTLPLCKDEWSKVLEEHDKTFHLYNCTIRSQKSSRKFATLHKKKIPTGDLIIPSDVKKAKHIRYKMTECANMSFMDEADDKAFAQSAKILSNETPSANDGSDAELMGKDRTPSSASLLADEEVEASPPPLTANRSQQLV